MSKSRIKRSYDNFCGEESMMQQSSPQCSPLRITSLTGQSQPSQFALNGTNYSSSTTSSASSYHMPQSQQRLNFDECKESAELELIDMDSHDGMQQATPPQPTASPSGFGNFNFTPTTTFNSLQPTQPQSSTTSSSSSFQPSPPPPSYFSPPPTSKRTRRQGQTDVSMMDEEDGGQHENTENQSNLANQGQANTTKHESPFPKLKRPPLDDLMFVPRAFKKQAIAAALSGPSSSSHATPIAAPLPGVHIPPPPSTTTQLPNYHHQLFTYDQVASIVKNAVEMREEQIREEYNKVLQDLLREQFENFSSFNRDYISRNMKNLDSTEDQENSYYS